MKKLQLLSTVAAAVLLTAGVSAAQTSGKEETHKSPQATSEQSKSGSIAREKSDKSQAAQEKSQTGKSANEERGAKEERGTGVQGKRGANESSGHKEGNESATTSQGEGKGRLGRDERNEGETEKQTGTADRMKGQHQDQTAGEKDKGGSSARSNQNEPTDQANQPESGKASSETTSGQSQSDMKSSNRPSETTGKNEGAEGGVQGHNAATNQSHTGANGQGTSGAKLTAEQRTKIRETVLARNNVPRVNRVDFAMNVGTVVPDSVRIVEVPSALADIDPAWRGDDYFVVRDEIVIVDHSRRIVATLPVGNESAGDETGTTATGGGAVASTAGLSQDEIREVQTVLIEKGLLKGRADGMFGPETREALIAFQKREGIEATGSIDTRTVTSLGLQEKIKAGGARGELGTDSSSPRGEGARSSGQKEGMKGGQPGNASETSRGAMTSEPKQGAPKHDSNPSEPSKGTRAGESDASNAKNAQPGKGSMDASPSNSGAQPEKEGTSKERDHRSER